MPIIIVEIVKTIDEREMQKTKEKQTDRKEQGNRNYSEAFFYVMIKIQFFI